METIAHLDWPSTVATVVPPGATPREANPFPYGYRDVPIRGCDGEIEGWFQQPLTLEDALHPEEGDRIGENFSHLVDRTYLFAALRAWFEADPRVLVLSDVNVDFEVEKLRAVCPDLIIFRIPKPIEGNFGVFLVETERATPEIVIELTSPSTRINDVEAKMRIYHRCHVPWYVLLDRPRRDAPLELKVHRRVSDGWQLEPTGDNRFHLPPLGLSLVLVHGRPRLFDPAGHPLGDLAEVVGERDAAIAGEEAAIVERDAAIAQKNEALARQAAAEQKLAELAEELRRLKRL
jgi:Uma2 family endonuclease